MIMAAPERAAFFIYDRLSALNGTIGVIKPHEF